MFKSPGEITSSMTKLEPLKSMAKMVSIHLKLCFQGSLVSDLFVWTAYSNWTKLRIKCDVFKNLPNHLIFLKGKQKSSGWANISCDPRGRMYLDDLFLAVRHCNEVFPQ